MLELSTGTLSTMKCNDSKANPDSIGHNFSSNFVNKRTTTATEILPPEGFLHPNISITMLPSSSILSSTPNSKFKRAIGAALISGTLSSEAFHANDTVESSRHAKHVQHNSLATISKAMMLGAGAKGGLRQKIVEVPDDMRTVDSTLIYNTLKPFFIAMKFSGIFFVRHRGHEARIHPVQVCGNLLIRFIIYSIQWCICKNPRTKTKNV